MFIPIKMLGSGSFGEVYLVKEKKLQPPKPDINMKSYAHAQNYMEAPDEQLRRIFDDFEELDPEIYENRTVQGWSFVQGAPTTGST